MVKVRWGILGGEEREEDVNVKTIEDLMRLKNISKESYVPTINGKVVTPDREVKEGDRIIFIPVVSGG